MYFEGVDISYAQPNYNFTGYETFVLLRTGYSTSKDKQFENNWKNCKSYKGVYHYSYANSVEEIVNEAKTIIKILNGRKLDLPVFIDLEDKSITVNKNELEKMYLEWEKIINKNGYVTGVYANLDWWRNRISTNVRNRAVKWVAKWSDKEPSDFHWDIWQYTSSNGKLDRNRVHDYYMGNVIKGKGGML